MKLNQQDLKIADLTLVERAVFLTVLHRLFAGGSDRAADRWREDYRIDGVEGLDLHHLYRAMAWLGEELAGDEQDGRTLAPRCLKDVMEERLFAKRRDLFSKPTSCSWTRRACISKALAGRHSVVMGSPRTIGQTCIR